MNKVRIEVDESLKLVLEDVKRELSNHIKRRYHIDGVEIYGNLASKVLAARYNHDKTIQVETKKKGNKMIIRVC